METMSLTNAASNAQPSEYVVTNNVLRKALDIQQQNALSLLEGLPQPASYNNPSHLGQTVDVQA
ncbi:MAG TPA: YjfB family protein [Chitinolyticbacter sp.]|uniref:YjfB family protein n=1 Tax=Chitinolyticbacter albus TaxID=2961951 RepID=UPI0021098BF8|nr:YjfB family protein [Chitinolyticbacter albus]HSC79107.1 YjfB family protein [Chitinolyticbacter sp.]